MLQLAELQKRENFTVEPLDVDSSKELQRMYNDLIPVLVADGKEICRYYLDEKALTDYFRSHASKVS